MSSGSGSRVPAVAAAARRRVAAAVRVRRFRLRHRGALAGDPTLSVRRIDGDLRLAHVGQPTTVQQVRLGGLAWVLGALAAAGVEHFVVPVHPHQRQRVGVSGTDRSAALDALRTAAAGTGWYARWGTGTHGSDRLLRDLVDEPPTDVLRVFQEHVWPRSSFRLGVQHAVELELWSDPAAAARSGWQRSVIAITTPAELVGALVAPRANDVAAVLPAAAREPATVAVAGASYPTVQGLAHGPFDLVRFPVDVVYTWVDDADGQWRRQMQHWRQQAGESSAPDGTDDARFIDRQELRYSLRSVEQFMPWVRHVYVVTADQRPGWLRTDHPRLTVVSHRDILRSNDLPTFNSSAIETGLHRIDGLSEHYLYLNDDVFVGRPVDVRSFFTANGVSRFFLSGTGYLGPGPAAADDAGWRCANKNARDLVAADFGVVPARGVIHSPYAHHRSVMAELTDRYAAAVDRTAAARFRSTDDVAMATGLHHYYSYVTGRAVVGDVDYAHANVSGGGLAKRLTEIERRRPEVFCLNDTDGEADTDEATTAVQAFLARYFPVPSSFER